METHLQCRCGAVRLDVVDAPIIVAECHCNSCRQAAARLSALPGAVPLAEANGGIHYVLYRKDRVSLSAGTQFLAEFRLKPDAPTRRVVATCCNTPIFTEFQHGHWLSLFGALWPEGARPRATLRTMLSDVPEGVKMTADIPGARTQSLGFFAKLLGAWIAMGFRTPKIAVPRQLHPD